MICREPLHSADSFPDARDASYLPTLDGWRAIAIVLVLMAHGGSAFVEAGWTSPNSWLAIACGYGVRGVDIFFALSGFLITNRLLREHARTGRIGLRTFYLRRAFRILPLYLAYLLTLSILGGLIEPLVTKRELVSCLFFFRNYIPAPTPFAWYTGHFWSLAVEEHFYLLWPVLFVVAGPRRAFPLSLCLAVAIAGWRALESRLHILPVSVEVFDHRTDLRVDGLIWGCLAAFCFEKPKVRVALARALTLPVWLALIVLCIVAEVRSFPWQPLWRVTLLAMIVSSSVLRKGDVAGRLLELQPIRWLGRISYSLYVWHPLFLLSESAHRAATKALIFSAPYNLIATFIVSSLSFVLLENPLTRVGKRLSSPPGNSTSTLLTK